MGIVMGWYIALFSSVGFAALLLGFTFSAVMLPVRRRFEVYENRISAKIEAVKKDIGKLDKSLKGEKRFVESEKIYAAQNYHPVHNVALGGSFFVMIPVLISAIYLFSGDSVLSGESFLAIDNLAEPDRLLFSFNLLPVLMIAVTTIDTQINFGDDRSAKIRFLVISGVLFALVYNLPAGLVLYWTGANTLSLLSRLLPKPEKA
jgi:membrane protein insertase Oxa1/YidC/SpoIIIJ